MATRNKIDSVHQGGKNAEHSIQEALLRSEIGFWRDLIETSRETEEPDSVERMHYAMALAELRLGQLLESAGPGTQPQSNPRTNVYPVNFARRISK